MSAAWLAVAVVACEGEDGAAQGRSLDDAASTDAHDARDTRGLGEAPTARIMLVNAAHDLGPDVNSNDERSGEIQLCLRQGSIAENLSVTPQPPLPTRGSLGEEEPAIPYGSAARIAAPGLNLASRITVPIVMNTKRLRARGFESDGPAQRPRRCDEILEQRADAEARLIENVDYWVFPPFEVGAIANDKAYVLALTGCAGFTATPNPGKCGVGFVSGGDPSQGNLRLTLYEIGPLPNNTAFGARLLYVSTQAHAWFSQAAAKELIQPGFLRGADGGSDFFPITGIDPPLGKLTPMVAVSNVQRSDAFVFGPKSNVPAEAAQGLALLPNSIEAIERSSRHAMRIESGESYVFIAVGDPDAVETKPQLDSGPNPRFFHFLAYPTD